MTTLRELPDLELGALILAMHEATITELALQGHPEIFSAATHALGAELFARRQGSTAMETRLFPATRLVELRKFRGVRALLNHVIEELKAKGFPKAAELLDERATEEIVVDTSRVTHGFAAAELRELH